MSFDVNTGSIVGTPLDHGSYTIFPVLSDTSSPPQMLPNSLLLQVLGQLRIATQLPRIRVGVPVRIQLVAAGGLGPYSWSLLSGNLPAGLTFDSASAVISGTPTTVGSQGFTVRVQDVGSGIPQTAQQTLTLSVVDTLGRNDTIATATPIGFGRYRASLSPIADPPGGPINPDVDVYQITAEAGKAIGFEIFAERLTPSSPLDSVIEIVDSNGVRFSSCSTSGTSGSFFLPCMNDDASFPGSTDSIVFFSPPGNLGSPVTFYVRVLSWTGDSRPDYQYEILVFRPRPF